LVFEDRRLTLAEFTGILDVDFVGHESLREEIFHRLPKFGNDLPEVDLLARQVAASAYRDGRIESGICRVAATGRASFHGGFFLCMGGLHLGLTLVDRRTLAEARKNPKQHATLCVHVTGFSEYFVSLSPVMQDDVIARTEY